MTGTLLKHWAAVDEAVIEVTGRYSASPAPERDRACSLDRAQALFMPRLLAILWVISIAVTGFFLFTGTVTFPGGAHHFTQWADILFNEGSLPSQVSQRDIGYPILIWLTGYPLTGSITGIILLQALFAILIPILIYHTIDKSHPVIAFLTALAAVASLVPYQFMKWIHHDQAYLFLTILTVYLFTLFARSGNYAFLYTLTLSSLAASLTRPAGNLIYPALLLLAYLYHREKPRHYIACVLLFLAVLGAYAVYRNNVFDVRPGKPMPSYTGEQIFYNLYMNSREFDVRLSADLGPNMRAIAGNVHEAMKPSPQESAFLKKFILTNHTATSFVESELAGFDLATLSDRILYAPNWEYYVLLCTASGGTDNSDLFLGASKEIASAYPLYVARYVARNLTLLLVDPGYAHTRGNSNPQSREGHVFLPGSGGVRGPAGVAERAINEMSYVPLDTSMMAVKPLFSTIAREWSLHYIGLVRFSLALLCVSILAVIAGAFSRLLSWNSIDRMCHLTREPAVSAAVLSSSLLLFYNALVTAALVEPSYRYHYFIILLQLIGAGCGALIVSAMIQDVVNSRARHALNPNVRQAVASLHNAVTGRATTDVRVVITLFGVSILAGWFAFMVIVIP